jgi:hypothetical protein
MKLGFTGTQFGMSPQQARDFNDLLHNPDICPVDELNEFHHGDCMGADADAFLIVQRLGWRTIAHPCDIVQKRAFTQSDVTMPVRRPLERNRIIVDTVDVLVAAPLSIEEVLRSGTWSTVRYARFQKKRHYLL